MDVDAIVSKTRSKAGLSESATSLGSNFNTSYKSQGSNGSGANPRRNSDSEAAGVAKLKSILAGGEGGSKLKGLAKEVIVARRLSTGQDPPYEGDDPDLVAPAVVLELWKAVERGVNDGSGK